MLYESLRTLPEISEGECPSGYYIKKVLVQLAYGRLGVS